MAVGQRRDSLAAYATDTRARDEDCRVLVFVAILLSSSAMLICLQVRPLT